MERDMTTSTPRMAEVDEEDEAMEFICDDDDDEMPIEYYGGSNTSDNSTQAAGGGTTLSMGLPAAPSRAAPPIFCSPTITPPAIILALESTTGTTATETGGSAAVGAGGLSEYVWVPPHTTGEDAAAATTGQSASPSMMQTASSGTSGTVATAAAQPVSTPVDKIGHYFGYNGTDALVPRAAYAAMLQRVRTLEANLGSANSELRSNATAMSEMEEKLQRLERLAKERDAQVRRLDELEVHLAAREHDLDARERALEQWSQQLLRRANSKRHQPQQQQLSSFGSSGEQSVNETAVGGSSGDMNETYRPAPLPSFAGGPWALAGLYGGGGGSGAASSSTVGGLADSPANVVSGGAPRRHIGADRREEEAYALWVRGGASGIHHLYPERSTLGGGNRNTGAGRFQQHHSTAGIGGGLMLPRLMPLRGGVSLGGVPARSQTSMDIL